MSYGTSEVGWPKPLVITARTEFLFRMTQHFHTIALCQKGLNSGRNASLAEKILSWLATGPSKNWLFYVDRKLLTR